MAQQEIEVILARNLASYLAIPIFIVDPDGTLMYYNDPAEKILGMRFAETGELRAEEWSTHFQPVHEDGSPLPPDSLPLIIALRERHPAHRSFWINGADNVRRYIQVTALPLVGQANRFLGALALFWEQQPK